MRLPQKDNRKKGISIIEILVVIFIIGVALTSLFKVATFSLKFSGRLKENQRALALAQEAMEAARNFRDGKNWSTNGLGSLSLDTAYHSATTADLVPAWNLALGEETIGIYQRKIIFSRVFRDTNDNISPSGTEDPGTRKVTVTISWLGKSINLVNYLTDWRQ